MRIVIIDDNEDGAMVLEDALTLFGHTVFRASDGPEGIGQIQKHHPDLVFCDIGMPKMSGYEVAAAVRADIGAKHTYMVAFTAHAYLEDRQQATLSGFNAHLSKPADLDKIQSLLEAVDIGIGGA